MSCARAIIAAIAIIALSASATAAIEASNRYRSPRNPERSVRKSTELIVLHTTEAPARSSLTKLSDRDEAHFCVTEDGTIYRIVDRDREAFHAGRSMWNGREYVDKFSVGIECVGYHDKAMPSVQIAAIRNLVAELKAMYRLSDDRVVCHSHVAYGAPNKWFRSKHRGRKRCGMLFAMSSVRKALGLAPGPSYDPDTRARRLTVADPYLNRVLYGKFDTMAKHYGADGRRFVGSPGGGSWFSRMLGLGGSSAQQKTSISAKPAPVRPSISAKPAAPKPAAPKPAVAKPTAPKPAATKPVAPKPAVATKQAPPRTIAELKARGYVRRGVVSKEMTAMKIAGAKWNSPDTYYTIRNKVVPGSSIDAARIEKGMSIWVKPK